MDRKRAEFSIKFNLLNQAGCITLDEDEQNSMTLEELSDKYQTLVDECYERSFVSHSKTSCYLCNTLIESINIRYIKDDTYLGYGMRQINEISKITAVSEMKEYLKDRKILMLISVVRILLKWSEFEFDEKKEICHEICHSMCIPESINIPISDLEMLKSSLMSGVKIPIDILKDKDWYRDMPEDINYLFTDFM